VIRSSDRYGKWVEQVAKEEGAYFIDLDNLVSLKYEELGADKVKPFFPADHTHTNLDGARINAQIVINAIKEIKPGKLKKYLSGK
jgi:rhamnogalacturonan acetylesterase